MAATLAHPRSRLLLPADAPWATASVDEADALRAWPRVFWRVADAIARIEHLLRKFPEGGALAVFLSEISVESPDRSLRYRAAVSSTLIANLELARDGPLAWRQQLRPHGLSFRLRSYGRRLRKAYPAAEFVLAHVSDLPDMSITFSISFQKLDISDRLGPEYNPFFYLLIKRASFRLVSR
jgi:hypothetical protein